MGDCLEVMGQIPDACVDLVLCDLPYGTTACKWDIIIPLEPLWEQYKRIAKLSAAIVLTSKQPFTTVLNYSNLRWFRYEIIWHKTTATGNMNANKMPLQAHENISVFYKRLPAYNPQMTKGRPYKRLNKHLYPKRKRSKIYGSISDDRNIVNKGTRYPRSVLVFAIEKHSNRLHPTQKPVALFEYLIKTYSNEKDLVLDNCMGSGTTAVAADRLGRKFFGCDINPQYVKMALERLRRDRESRAQLELL